MKDIRDLYVSVIAHGSSIIESISNKGGQIERDKLKDYSDII